MSIHILHMILMSSLFICSNFTEDELSEDEEDEEEGESDLSDESEVRQSLYKGYKLQKVHGLTMKKQKIKSHNIRE